MKLNIKEAEKCIGPTTNTQKNRNKLKNLIVFLDRKSGIHS